MIHRSFSEARTADKNADPMNGNTSKYDMENARNGVKSLSQTEFRFLETSQGFCYSRVRREVDYTYRESTFA